MLNALLARIQQKHRTMRFPDGPPPQLSDRFAGRPVIRHPENCQAGCRRCVDVCPVDAIEQADHRLRLDLGQCIFCTKCAAACDRQGIRFSDDYRMSTRGRNDLAIEDADTFHLAAAQDHQALRLFGHSLKLRQVSAGGCNACEVDINVLGTVGWDMGRFGIQFVASPRHADGLVVTGPVTENMRQALLKTYTATPDPKVVIAVGACAISGGIYKGHPESHDGIGELLPVDLYIPGCPPHPLTILDGLLRLMGRIK